MDKIMRGKRFAIALGILSWATLPARAQGKSVRKAYAVPASLRFVVAPTGNEARYRVREQIISFDLPNDAVGVTHDITGGVTVTPTGTIISDSSRIVVNLTNLTSDKDRRDKYIKSHTMDINKFPTVTLVPKSFVGLSTKPGAAPSAFSVIGDLTVHGVTHPTTWTVTAHSDGADVVGSAATAFTFADFALDQPRLPFLLSVADTIKLEYDFRFTPAVPGL